MSDMERERDELRAEVERLSRWKAEATEVILGLQDLGKALGLRLGEPITGGSATEAAKRLTARAEAAEATVARVEALAADMFRHRTMQVGPLWRDFLTVDDLRAALHPEEAPDA